MDAAGVDSRLPGWIAGLALLAGTVLVGGLATYLLSAAGHDALATGTWVTVYGGALLAGWVFWLRGVEFGGPRGR